MENELVDLLMTMEDEQRIGTVCMVQALLINRYKDEPAGISEGLQATLDLVLQIALADGDKCGINPHYILNKLLDDDEFRGACDINANKVLEFYTPAEEGGTDNV